MKAKTTVVLVVMLFLFGISTTIQSNHAHATSSEKIPLVQKLEQFPEQEITGFCYLQLDDEGNLDWRIKVYGLVPETQGHFDLGHWAGEVDVPFTAGDDGNADSKNQIVLAEDVPLSLFSQFVKCQVLSSGFTHFTSPVIAVGVPGDGGEDTDEDKNQNLDEEKFFLFAALDFLFGIFSNIEDESVGTNSNFGSSTSSSNNPSPSNAASNSIEHNEDTEEKSTNKNSIKENKNFPEINSAVNTIKEEQGKADKGNGDKGNDKGKADKGNGDKGNDKGKADKGNGDKGNDKGKADKGNGDKGNDKGKADKGNGDKGKR